MNASTEDLLRFRDDLEAQERAQRDLELLQAVELVVQ